MYFGNTRITALFKYIFTPDLSLHFEGGISGILTAVGSIILLSKGGGDGSPLCWAKSDRSVKITIKLRTDTDLNSKPLKLFHNVTDSHI
jgi:hypothetical protein